MFLTLSHTLTVFMRVLVIKMAMWKIKKSNMVLVFPFFMLLIYFTVTAAIGFDDDDHKFWGNDVAKRDEWRSVVQTEYGKIRDINVSDGSNGSYYLQLITLEPNALFLPVILHADMLFYVHTGSGRVSWTGGEGGEENGKKHKDKDGSRGVSIQRGDVYRLQPGTIFYIQSNLENERQKLRIYAIFANSIDDLREPVIGPYSGIRDLVLGFDKKIIQAAFQIPEETVEEITSGSKPPPIVHALQNSSSRTLWDVEAQLLDVVFGRKNYIFSNKKEKSSGVFNILSGDRDVENCNGWSTTVTSKQARPLRGSNIGLFMVNMSKGAMMGPHWNPIATEIAIVLEGQGMVNVVCPGITSGKECKNTRLRVEEGDVFVVPRYHPMAQMAFNNGTFVFMGFTTRNRNNHPQFLAGQRSVLRTLNTKVLAESFGVSNLTMSQLLEPQHDSILLECISCAEEEERLMEEEIERKKEEARRREEESKREEEKRKQEEEARKRAEEEARRKEEEEATKRAEEEARRKEEEEATKRAEEEARKRAEEEAIRKAEEEARKRAEEEARRKEEEARKRAEEKEREREKEEARRRAEEEARRKEEEAARKREEEREREKEEARKRAEEEAARKREEEKERKKQEEAKRREEEEARKRQEEEEAAQHEETRRQQEAAREAAAARRAKEEKQAREQKEARERAQEEEDMRRKQEEQEEAKRQQEAEKEAAARRAKEEEQAREQKEAREREKEKSQVEEEAQQEEMRRQQEAAKEAAGKRKKEEEQEGGRGGGGGQEKAEYQTGSPGEGKRRRVLTDMWTG